MTHADQSPKRTTAALKTSKALLKVIKFVIVALIAVVVLVAALNLVVINKGSSLIVEQNEAKKADCIIVLGAMVWGDTPSYMLQDRLDEAFALYNAGVSDKILVSGDHGTQGYDEVNTMRRYLEDKGVPSDRIFMDHAGFDTYATMYRARDVFMVKSAVIVTQKYHLFRALFIADNLGIAVQGVPCDRYKSPKQLYYDFRELFARTKDFFTSAIIKPKPKYLGDELPISGSGIVTHDN